MQVLPITQSALQSPTSAQQEQQQKNQSQSQKSKLNLNQIGSPQVPSTTQGQIDDQKGITSLGDDITEEVEQKDNQIDDQFDDKQNQAIPAGDQQAIVPLSSNLTRGAGGIAAANAQAAQAVANAFANSRSPEIVPLTYDLAQQPPSSRWVIPQNSEISVVIAFRSDVQGTFETALHFELTEIRQQITVVRIKAVSALPSIIKDPKLIFRNVCQRPDVSLVAVHRMYVPQRDCFEFGPVLVAPLSSLFGSAFNESNTEGGSGSEGKVATGVVKRQTKQQIEKEAALQLATNAQQSGDRVQTVRLALPATAASMFMHNIVFKNNGLLPAYLNFYLQKCAIPTPLLSLIGTQSAFNALQSQFGITASQMNAMGQGGISKGQTMAQIAQPSGQGGAGAAKGTKPAEKGKDQKTGKEGTAEGGQPV
ncbi:MAG: hypothetical protein EZS28_043220, partial [Streblomastix strix]